MKYLMLVIALIIANSLFSQKTFTQKQLFEDLAYFAQLVVNNDPLSTKAEKQKAKNYFDSVASAFNQDTLTAFEFSRYLMELRPPVKFDNHAAITVTDSLPSARLFPLPIMVVNKKLIVNSDNASIPFGSIIHNINGKSSREILEEMVPDSSNTFAMSNMVVYFSFMYLVKFGSQNKFTIDYSAGINQVPVSTTLTGIDIPNYMKLHNRKVFPLSNGLVQSRYYDDIKTYYLQLNSFEWPSEKNGKGTINSFKHLFDSLFNNIQARNIQNLIIDLKHNSGGDINIPFLLFSYLYKSSFNVSGDLKAPLSIPLKNLSAINNVPVASEAHAMDILKQLRNNFRTEEEFAKAGLQYSLSPQPQTFKNNLYILVGEHTFSGGALFTALVKAYKRGVLIGEKVGGSIYDMTAGVNLTYQLPNTKIQLSTPIMAINFSDSLYKKVPEKFISPDITFPFDLKYKYFLQKKDVDLEETLLLIKRKEK